MQDIPEDVAAQPQPLKAILDEVVQHALSRSPRSADEPLSEVHEDGKTGGVGPTQVSAVTTRLRTKGQDTIAHETNLARAPVWNSRAPARSDQLVTLSMLYGQPFQQKGGQPLTAADQRWFAELTNRWVREGCPASLRVAFSLREAAALLGYSGGGGRQLQMVSSSLVRLRSATFVSVLRRPDGGEKRTTWGLIDLAQAIEPRTGPGRGWAELNRQMAALLQEGSVTYLHAPTWDKLRERDELAARLWVFLEAERLPAEAHCWRYPFFANSTESEASELPAIAQLLGLQGWTMRYRAVERARRAAEAIVELDPRYVLEIPRGARQGTWRLEARRRRLLSSQ